MAIFAQSTLKINKMISDIELGTIKLPNFQRDYKWNPPKVKSLINSIQHLYPAGSLLFLRLDKDEPLLPGQPFKYVSGVDPNSTTKYLVLDGQQRMTSCYCAFANKGYYTYYIDYIKLMNQWKSGATDFDFEELIINKRHNQTPQNEISNGLFPLDFLRDRTALAEAVRIYVRSISSDPTKAEVIEFLNYQFRNIVDPIMDYEFPVIELSDELSLEAVCKVFQTINTTGLKLSVFDICVAVHMPNGINLKEYIRQVGVNYPYAKIALEKDEIMSLQTVALLANRDPKVNTLAKVVTTADISRNWDDAIKGIDLAMRLMDSFGAGTKKNTALLPYTPLIPVIASVLISRKYDTLNVGQQAVIKNKIRTYFFVASLTSRFTEGTNNKVKEDFNSLLTWTMGPDASKPAIIEAGVNWNTKAYLETQKGSAFGKAILCVLNSRKPRDFYKDTNVGIGETLESCDLHHIFPKASYEHGNENHINSVFNFTWLTKESNQFISDKTTKKYLEDIENSGTSEVALKNSLASHMIDSAMFESMKKENFEAFIIARAEAFKNILSSYEVKFNETNADAIGDVNEDADSEEEETDIN